MRSILLLAGLLVVAAAGAQVPDAPPVDLHVTDVAVFRHGYGFVMAEGQARPNNGWAVIANTPQAALGTLWLYSSQEGVTVDRTIAEVREVKQMQRAESLPDLLAANVGAPVTLVVLDGAQVRTVTGTLEEPVFAPTFPAAPRYDNLAQPPELQDEQAIWAAVPPPDSGTGRSLVYVMLRTRGGDQAIPPELVRDISFGRPVRREAEVTRPKQMLAARLVRDGKAVGGAAPLGVGYLAKGLRWIPSYRVQILKDGQARLQLQGNVINDVTDLEGSRLHLVVGVPHFIQQDVLSPLSLQMAWTRLSSYFASAQGRPQDMFSNALMSQTAGTGSPGPADPARYEGASGSAVAPVSGEAVEELYYYSVPEVTLKRGSRAAVTVFDSRLPYEDVYLLRIVDDADYAYRLWSPRYDRPRGPQTPDEEALLRETLNPKVWHALRLKNAGPDPWTTAPAMIVRDWQPIAQSLMLYTPVGGTMDLTTTAAPDINSRRSDREISRKAAAVSVSGRTYDQLTVSGEVKVSNHKSKPVRLTVTRRLEGAVTESSDGARVSQLAELARGLNPTSEIVWDLSVAAGEEKTLTYSYTVYIPT